MEERVKCSARRIWHFSCASRARNIPSSINISSSYSGFVCVLQPLIFQQYMLQRICVQIVPWYMILQFTDKITAMLPDKYSQLGYVTPALFFFCLLTKAVAIIFFIFYIFIDFSIRYYDWFCVFMLRSHACIRSCMFKCDLQMRLCKSGDASS